VVITAAAAVAVVAWAMVVTQVAAAAEAADRRTSSPVRRQSKAGRDGSCRTASSLLAGNGMKTSALDRYALGLRVATALFAGCGGSQPPIGAPGAMPQSRVT